MRRRGLLGRRRVILLLLVHNADYNSNKGITPLPSLDSTGKVHGVLPKPQNLKQYPREELIRLRDELKQRIQERIDKNIQLGSDKPHGQRQAAEQDLIHSINTFSQDN